MRLDPSDLEQIDDVAPREVAAGERYNETPMQTFDG
jgi:hypothetical protein